MTNRRERGADRSFRRNISRSLLLGAALFALSSQAHAQGPPPTPEEELVLAQLDYQKAKGLKAYTALREIWRLWEDVEPLRVEMALNLAAEDQSKSGPVRQYARMLTAYSRLRRGDLTASQRAFSEAGYVTNWLVVGPFDNEGKAGFAQEFGPDAEPASPIVPGRAYTGKERPVRYRLLPSVFKYGWVDFGYVMRPSTHICAYATTFVSYERDPEDKKAPKNRTITIWAGSDGAHRVSLNGKSVIEETAYRGFDIDRSSATVVLRPGQNRLSVKACGADETPMFAVRLADENGLPDAHLLTTTDFKASEDAEQNVHAQKDEALPTHKKSLAGPLRLVQEITEDKNASAEDLELATRYLVLTGGDDETVHQARNLAQRAVDKKPSIERHLLLAELSEDRNTAHDSIQKAAALTEGDNIEVLLAEAHHKRTGPSPQKAFPLYDQILAQQPDNLTALRGRVELYNAAGLRRTALGALEKAYVRRPHSVLLANMVASQRAALGMTSLAQEAEDRYSARRYDDNSYLTSRMELALSRRHKKDTLHFLSRLVDSDPQSLWVHTASSRVHRALGDQKRALFDLEHAKSIAPEDIGVLQGLADLQGRMGHREQQLELLEEVLRLRPQEVEVRKYVDHIKPPEQPADEKYAMDKKDFLKKRHAPADGHPRRTLQDLTVSTVYKNGLSSQFRQVVFQPLTDAAAATARQYAFQYQADSQRVQLKGARVYRADGRVDEAIESGEGAANDPSISMYTSARTYYVQFPRLEPGDVVELRYRIDDITPRNEFADYFGDIIYMQSDEPVGHAHYVLVTPKSRKLNIDAKVPGLKKRVTETSETKVYEFEASDVPAISPEANMPPWSEVLGFVHVSTYSTWNELGKWYWGLVQEQLDLDEETRKKLRDITKDAKTEVEKVQAVYGWVTKNTRYVALEFGIYGFKPRRCVQTVNRGWGDCKDKATVIVTFLRELGIDANLVIVRTGMRGDFRSELPSLAPFDHAIAYVPSLKLYLDGTAEHTGIYELPVMDQGALGLLVLDGKAKLVRLPAIDPARNILSRDLTVDLKKDGGADLKLKYEVTGNAAPGFRASFEAEGTLHERVSQNMGSEFPGIEIGKNAIKTNNLSDIESPVEMTIDGKVPRFARKEGDSLSMPVTLNVRLTPTYAALSKRKQDVLIQGFSNREETVTLKLPQGAKVDALPPDSSHKSRFGSYSVSVTQEGQTLKVVSKLSVTVTRVEPKDYAAFRKFCVSADQALAHRLVVTP